MVGDPITDRVRYSVDVQKAAAARGFTDAQQTAFKKNAQIAPGSAVLDFINMHRQIKSMAMSVNIFATAPSVDVVDGVARVALPHRELPVTNEPLSEEVGRDFGEHFPELEGLMTMMLMARFAKDRRRAFVWLQAPSDWGKGLLVAALKELGLVFELSVEQVKLALSGASIGFDPNTALRAWVMFVDEFNAAAAELKQLNSSINVTAKWQLQTELPLYTKLFASKENVRSLVGGGAEQQFNNRFSLMQGDGSLDERELFKRIGGAAYMRALSAWIGRFFNAGVARMRAMGRPTAELEAQRWMDEFQQAHMLSVAHGTLEDTLREVADQIGDRLMEYGRYPRRPWNRDELDFKAYQHLRAHADLRYTKGGGEVLVIKRLEGFVRVYLTSTEDKSTAAKLAYRAEEIARLIDQRAPGERLRLFRRSECEGAGEQERGALVFLEPVTIPWD